MISKTSRDSKPYNNQVRKNGVQIWTFLEHANVKQYSFLLEACTLFCRKGYLLYPKGFVKDGTKCLHGANEGNDVCIGGKCMV